MDALKIQIDQLRGDVAIQRKPISECSKDLLEYCEKNKPNDLLLSGPQDGHNPFQEKKSCSVL